MVISHMNMLGQSCAKLRSKFDLLGLCCIFVWGLNLVDLFLYAGYSIQGLVLFVSNDVARH